ncbi:MAG: acyltransferase [Cyanobacteria bacterium P01_A01_bin.123]
MSLTANDSKTRLSSIKPRPKLLRLQWIRGTAAILIVLFHATEISNRKFDQPFYGNIFSWGDGGVDLFFVLSGFIVWYVHSRDFHQPQKLGPFLLKRGIRIYPLYWLLTLMMVAVYLAIPGFGAGHETQPLTILKSLLLIPVEPFPVLTVGWYLCHEIFFYGFIALLIGLRPKMVWPIIGLWLGATLALGMSSAFGLLSVAPSFTVSFLLSLHNLEFALGMGVGWLVLHRSNQCPGQLLLGVGLVGFVLAGLMQAFGEMAWPTLIAYGLPSVLIILGAAVLDLQRPLLVPGVGAALGDVSYALYLSHYAVLSAVGMVLTQMPLGAGGILLGLSIGIAIAIAVGFWLHYYLEKPMMKWLKKQLI